jgi:hypothetical protein
MFMSRHFEMGVSSVVSWLLQFGGYQSHKCNDLTQSTWFGNPWEKSSAMQKGSELGKFGRFYFQYLVLNIWTIFSGSDFGRGTRRGCNQDLDDVGVQDSRT